jgi:AcrR family transcriptional regulator
VADILEAAVHVLEREGGQRFTTIRVAKVAGVSVGSLYQYFPNKLAILRRLQLDEWEKTGQTVDAILADESLPPPARLRALLRAFFRSECDEAPLRRALDAAAPSYLDAPESRTRRRHSQRLIRAFLLSAAPRATPAERRFAAQLLFMTMISLGKELSERPLRPTEIDHWADATAEMLTLYLARLDGASRTLRRR